MVTEYLALKHEDEVHGEAIGPMVIIEVDDAEAKSEGSVLGTPYVSPCFCDQPKGENLEECGDCGKLIERWVTQSEAEAKAKELGIEFCEA